MAANLRTIERTIVAVLIYDKDGYLLMGRKNPTGGGTYINSWHVPGGGQEPNETTTETAVREVFEEVGIKLQPEQLQPVKDGAPEGQSEKTLPSGEVVNCRMFFHRYAAHLDKNRADIKIRPSGELVDLKWFAPDELDYFGSEVMYVQPK